MDELVIVGGRPLRGEVTPSGSKNAGLPLLAASLLAREPVRLDHLPRVRDVHWQLQILAQLGMRVERGAEYAVLHPPTTLASRGAPRAAGRLRAGFLILAPLLARTGRAVVPFPGGCRLGARPVDIHLRGLAALGADLRLTAGRVLGRCPGFRGARVSAGGPRGPSVTGTAQLLSAAVLARGRSVIEQAAREPEIGALIQFLNQLGARVSGGGTDRLEIEGVDSLGGGAYTLPVDRMESLTWLLAAAATGGEVLVRRAPAEELAAVFPLFRAAGAELHWELGGIRLRGPSRPWGTDYTAGPYPAPPTDAQPLWSAWMARAEGESQIADPVFPGRWTHLPALQRLGARVERRAAGECRLRGVPQLVGAELQARDLRGAAAVVLAALSAEGVSRIRGLAHLDRGYERFTEKLQGLGGEATRIPLPRAAGDAANSLSRR